MSKEQQIFNYLYEIGCCKYCCLRYICIRCSDTYLKVDSYIKDKNYATTEVKLEDNVTKKHKPNPCIVCLGLLQDFAIDNTVEQVSTNKEVCSYDSAVFTCSVSIPACVQIREHSMRLDLEKKFPDYFTEELVETQMNKAWKWLIKDKLTEKLNKKFECSETCEFSINISMGYELDNEELAVLLKMQPDMFNKRQVQHRKYRGELYSRKGVLAALAQTRGGVFREYSSVPPEVSTKAVTCDEVQCNHNSIYLAGRYCKYSRELSQTPWIISGKRTMESSVQEVISEPIQNKFGIPEDKLKFSSSGREDVDVRCLGKGRPFVLEYLNPKKTQFTSEEFREIEADINESPLVFVRDLQLIPREELIHIKAGEETKTKEYVALCVCEKPVTEEMMNKINEQGIVELSQKTPIRVLHRRPLAIRNRTVFNMSAAKMTERDDLFKLKITTQAGTYVKEFVHGDFNRTIPNIGLMISSEVDILALDVLSINLDWPKEVIYDVA